MPSGIEEPSLKSIEALLMGRNTRFYVPTYQRNFAWGKDQVEELWEDLEAAVGKADEDYFMGTIVVQDKGHDEFEVIDGQQRLACISMIFSAIRNAYDAHNDRNAHKVEEDFLASVSYRKDVLPQPKLALNSTNDTIYREYVIGNKSEESVTQALSVRKALHPSNAALLEAYRYFLQRVAAGTTPKGQDYDAFLLPLLECLSRRFKVIFIPVSTEEGAYLVFEAVNARGTELAVSDLVKNRLYYEVGPEQVENAQNLWGQMDADLRGNSIPEYLRHFWIAKKASEDGPPVREKKLYRAIRRSIPTHDRQAAAVALLTDLANSAGDYAKISDYNLWPDNSSFDSSFEGVLRDLRLFGVSQCYPALLNVIQKYPQPSEVARSFQLVANFSFRYNIIGAGTSGSLEAVFGKIAYQIRVGNYTTSRDIADDLRGVNSDAKFRQDFETATLTKDKIARYTLGSIENYLARQSGAQPLGGIDPFARQVTLEHILPQNVDKHDSWRPDFKHGADSVDWIYRIGNLTLATKKMNRELADKSFREKLALGLGASQLLIDRYVVEADRWGDQQIQQRQQALAKAAVQVWKL